jgi:2-polyprenyl-3-methyl-5-hydroxy-6-metoxy-1,4-benzoquinol methylase
MKVQKSKFEEDYFEGYYKSNVGDFETKDLERAMNWFKGWFKVLQKDVDLKKGDGRRAMEIGCSIGGASFVLHDRGFEVVATDISKYAVGKAKKLAKKTGRKIDFAVVNIEKKIDVVGKFDLIICFEVLEHLEDPLKAIKNMKAKLKKGGVLICSTPNGEHDVYIDPTHINVRPKKEWVKAYKAAGFKRPLTRQVTFLPFLYRLHPAFTFYLPIRIYSRYINSPFFIIGKN